MAGNVPLPQAVQNALYTVELCGSTVPVHAGAAAPLVQPLGTAQDVHGDDGMGDIGLPLSGRSAASERAIDVLIDTILTDPGEIVLITLGPLTNVAAALRRAPAIAEAVEHCFIMGGSGSGTGNVTPLAEYNFWADPEAADIVVASAMPKTIIGWDISVASASFNDAEAAEVRALGTPFAEFAVDIQGVLHDYAKETTELPGFDLPDPIAMAVALDPSIAKSVERHVRVVTGNGPARGTQETDWLQLVGRPSNTSVVTAVSRSDFLSALIAGLS